MKRIVLLTALALGMALPALAEPPQVKNGMIVDDEGMTLYTLDRDSAGTSMCNDGCAMKWPPAMADAYDKASGDFGLMKRGDGMQWTYKGIPLYRWSMDKQAGDAMGDGMAGGMWHAAKP